MVGVALAETPTSAPPKVDSGDTSWILISSALVMLMTPGLALFYGGMVRSKNVLGTIMQSFIALGVITIQWVLYGYSLAFGPDIGGIIGSLKWVGLSGVGLDPFPDYAATIPHQAFMIFQMMFAVITPALITGAFAERFKFKTYLVFLILWATFVYDPLAHWVWGVGGWIRNLGALDFAGRACRPYQLWNCCIGCYLGCREKKRVRGRAHASSQLDHDPSGCSTCYGLDGLVSMAEVPWHRALLQPMPLW